MAMGEVYTQSFINDLASMTVPRFPKMKLAILCALFSIFCLGASAEEIIPYQKGVQQIFLTDQDRKLALAALKGDKATVEKLLAEGAQIDCRGEGGKTPLMVATWRWNVEATRLLLEKGANPNLEDDDGFSAISMAARVNKKGFLEMVLKHGGDPNHVSTKRGTVPLNDAIISSLLENAKTLVKAGANVNYQETVTHDTLLTDAAISRRYDIAYFLLESGADPKIENADGLTINYFIQAFPYGEQDPPNANDIGRRKTIEWLKKINFWRKEESPYEKRKRLDSEKKAAEK